MSEAGRKENGEAPHGDVVPEGKTGEAPEDDALPLTGAAVEPMRLRADPPRVTRLSRKILAGIGAVVGLGLGAALMYGLQSRDAGRAPEELVTPGNRNPPPGMDRLPADYGGVPPLGPPLPGDLGRSIVDAQNRGQPVPVPPAPPGAPVPAQTGPDPDEQRRRQEIEAARTSQLFAATQSGQVGGASSSREPPPLPQPDLASLGLAPLPATPSAEARQQAFLNAEPDRRTVAPDRVAAPASLNVLQAGAVIPAALITGIRSDLPGQITAQVTEHVYDSPTGRILLVPQGTRVIGQYDNDVGFGQRRVLLVWTRLIFPNGRSIVLERQPGADGEGYAGVEDGVDHHWVQLARAAALSTLLSIGAQAGTSSDESDLARAIRQGASDGISQTGRQIVGRQLDIAPTLTIRPGFPVRVLVTRDLVLEPYGDVP